MKYSSLVIWLFVSNVFFVPFTNADIIYRGNGLIYDSDQDLTWTQNANINGAMPQGTALIWAENLVYRGFDDWRLANTTQFDDPTCLYDSRADPNFGSIIFYERHEDCLGGEMELLTAAADPFNNPLFENVSDSRYWTATPYRDGIDPCREAGTCVLENDNGIRVGFIWQWSFAGAHKTTLRGGNYRYIWPVRDGDVVAPDSSGVLMDDLSFHSPSLDYQTEDGTVNLWKNFNYYGQGPNNELLWSLVDFGINAKAFTGTMTGKVAENLSIEIPSLNFQGTSYWVVFDYFGQMNDVHLWQLREYGIN